MKKTPTTRFSPRLFCAISALIATALPVALSAAIPQRWTVETSRVQPAQFEAYHGETIEFAATIQSDGKPLAITNDLIGIYWQTNGMGSAYWTAPAVLSNNVMIARWEPSMDVGANVYSCFIGTPGEIYRAAFQLRLRPSPGAVPSELPLPVKTLDFAQVTVLNAPYYSKSETDAALSDKQDVVSDLASIRSGAALGATAVQPAAISDMETQTHAAATYQPKGSYLTSESDPSVPSWAKATTKPSYTWSEIGSKPTFAAVATSGAYSDLTGKPSIPTDSTVSGWGYIKSYSESDPSVPSWAKATTKPSYTWSEIGSKPTFAAVATSGAYSDLTGKPSIPTDSTVSGWGYIKSWTETDPTISAWAKATSKPSYSWSEIGSKPTFAAVATSGNYNDLSNKPTIPAVINPAVATTRGSAADAKDTKDALAALSDTVDTMSDSKLDKADVIKQSAVTSETPDGKAADAKDLKDQLAKKVDEYAPPFSTVTYNGVAYTEWTLVDGPRITLKVDVSGVLTAAAQFNASTGIFISGAALFDGVAGVSGVSPTLRDKVARESALADKQDTISDLASIRSGAALGATAVQPAALSDMETQTHAAATYQSKGSYLTSESDPTVDNKLAPIETIVSAWQTYWDGDDVRVTVTNYYGSQDLPSLYIEQKISDGGTNYYKTIWTEKARLNVIFDRLLQLESDVATKADRAWGYYDSHAGTYAPDGFTSISSESILISKDMSYQKTVTSGGEVWVLTATDPTVITGAETNGFFRISDSEGNSIFEVVKGDKRIAPATVSSVTVGGNSLTINFNVESAAHPSLEICSNLVDADWKAEDEASCPATVVWSGTSGSYVATVTGKAAMPKMFVKGTYEVGGETYARHGVPLGFDRVVIGGVFYRVAVETVSGKKLMTLTEL